MEAYVAGLARRELTVVPKWQRGGRVSGLNTGLTLATTEVLMAMDGDTSFDNDMVAKAVGHFLDPEVVGVAGSLRVRNVAATLWTRLQAIEYALSIQSAKAGLSEFNVVNNISGAFGIFRIDLSQAFLQGCAALERTLAKRKRGCYSRPTGRNFSRPSRRPAARSQPRALQKRSAATINLLSRSELPEGFRAAPPQIPEPCRDEPALKAAVLDDH
jgi:hypothetical protein